ncbi:hypothetical protein [Brucella intermedia]|uniref:hypothetical protein n=1 Tax=Brucella intermedia TaxID=94625 RepID=UPI00158DD414|nr:hypothetical protein [Brucella intermedia]NYD84181.1 hypothetical protein [Brucella intermedia]
MKRIGSAILIATLMTAISGQAQSAETGGSIFGTWKGKYAESCKAVRNETTEDFLLIGKKNLKRYEGDCAIIKHTSKGASHTIQFLCETEGETVRDSLKITQLNANKISIAGAGEYERCK